MDKIKKTVIELFKDKTDRGGNPYIGHLLRVAQEAEALQAGSYLTGILHDTLEDTDFNEEDLLKLGVDNQDITRVRVLTKKNHDVYGDYINRINKYATEHKDKIILAVKIADLNDNLNVARLKSLNTRDLARLKRYIKAKAKLSKTFEEL